MGILDRAAIACLPLLPRALMRSVASRYIAGETLPEALDRLKQLQAGGFLGIIDILGEDAHGEAEARAVVQDYTEAAHGVSGAGLDCYVSVKPTHVGLRTSEELALELYGDLARSCADLDLFLRVEMEDRTTTDATLRIFEQLRAENDNLGLVLQSRLLRTPEDIRQLKPGPLSVRMVKGIYLEPSEVAHVDAAPIRDAFLECTRQLFERGAYVSFATHDKALGDRLLELVSELGLPRDRYEFQVLLGVQRHLWQEWKRAGHPVRVYVPYGPEWRAYSTRRLRKNPQIFGHVMRDFFSFR